MKKNRPLGVRGCIEKCVRQAGLVTTVLSLLLAGSVDAAPFTDGNLVIYRVGSGTGNLVNTGNPVFLDEYTTAGALVQSVALPTTASLPPNQLIASGTAPSEDQQRAGHPPKAST